MREEQKRKALSMRINVGIGMESALAAIISSSPPHSKSLAGSLAMATITTNPSWLPWSTFVAIILLNTLHVRKQLASTSLHQKEEEQQEEEESQSPPLISFPWEPNNAALSDTTLPSSSSPPQETKQQTSNNTRAEEQLQFLACMTFANGGLRSPSCPCCQ